MWLPVELHSVGKEVITRRYDDGVLVRESSHLVYDGYLLNPANGRTVSSKVAGADRPAISPTGRSTSARPAPPTATCPARAW